MQVIFRIFFGAGAIFGNVGVSLFVAGAAFGDVAAQLFVAVATFGDVGVSLFVSGAACGEIWQNVIVIIFNTKCVSEARKVTLANGRVSSCSDHGRMLGPGSSRIAAHCKCRFNVFGKFLLECNFAWAGAVYLMVSAVAPRTLNDVSYVTGGSIMRVIVRARRNIFCSCRMTVLWQAHYLVTLDGACCCSAHCQ